MSAMCLYFSVQEYDIIEHTNAKCRVSTVAINLLTIM